jgi:hypothetical protein
MAQVSEAKEDDLQTPWKTEKFMPTGLRLNP